MLINKMVIRNLSPASEIQKQCSFHRLLQFWALVGLIYVNNDWSEIESI